MIPNSTEENELWLRFFRNDRDAQTQLILMYRNVVDSIARHLKRRLPTHIRMDDLVTAGHEGLWKAMQAYSLEKGAPFDRFARARVRGAMIDELRRADELTRSQRTQWKQAQNAYGAQQAHNAYGAQQAQYQRHVSLDEVERLEWIVDDTALSPEDAAVQSSEIAELNRAIIKLSEQEQLVLAMVFMEGLNLAETAEVLSLSRSRVSAIYNQALKSLKGSMLRAQRAR